MDERVKKLLINLASKWKEFAYATGFGHLVVDYIDIGNKSDELKLESFLKKLIKRNPTNYMILIEKSLADIGKLDILKEIKLLQASDMLKSYYTKSYGHKNTFGLVNTDLLINNVELAYIDAKEVLEFVSCEKFDEWDYFVKKPCDVTNTIIALEEMSFPKSKLVLFSGITGIGKTCFLQKCVFCWAKGLLWKNVDFLFYFDFKKLNEICHVLNAQEFINKFYKNILKGLDIMGSQMNIMFVLDGLDEFVYLEEFYKCISGDSSNLSILSTLMDVFSTRKIKCVLGGRVESVMKYHSLSKNHNDILHIQIMGFSNLAIGNYFESTLLCKTLRDDIAELITSSPVAKALLSVPFNTKAVCSTLSLCFGSSLKTMTELQTLIFLYFVQQINKATEPLYLVIQENKQHILNVCKVAFNMLERGMVKVSKAELATVLDKNGFEPFGLIIKSSLANEYQFVHLFLMTFCASVHLYFYKSPQEVFQNENLRSCLPVVCGLRFGDGRNVVSLITKLQKPVHTDNSLLKEICELIPSSSERLKFYFKDMPLALADKEMFMECFFEAQALITDDLVRSIGERNWTIYIHDRKTPHQVSHEKYFMEKFIDAGFTLDALYVGKNVLSKDEKKLLTLCSTKVCTTYVYLSMKIDTSEIFFPGLLISLLLKPISHIAEKPTQKVEKVVIYSSKTFVSKNEFEDLVLPLFRLTNCLELHLREDMNFINDIYEWLLGSNIKYLYISYRGYIFQNIEELKKFVFGKMT